MFWTFFFVCLRGISVTFSIYGVFCLIQVINGILLFFDVLGGTLVFFLGLGEY